MEEGEFEKAKLTYFQLLDDNPEMEEWTSGYSIAGYWDNRIDAVHLTKEGLDRAQLLLKYLEQFQTDAKKQGWYGTLSFHGVSRCILQEILLQFSLSPNWDPKKGYGDATQTLAEGFFLSGLPNKTIEILAFLKKKDSLPVKLHFVLAESLLVTGKYSEGKDEYLTAFLRDPQSLDPVFIHWEPLRKLSEEFVTSCNEELFSLALESGLFEGAKETSLEPRLELTKHIPRQLQIPNPSTNLIHLIRSTLFYLSTKPGPEQTDYQKEWENWKRKHPAPWD